MATGLIGKLFYCDVNGNYRPGQTGTQPQTRPPVTVGPLTGVQTGAQTVKQGLYWEYSLAW